MDKVWEDRPTLPKRKVYLISMKNFWRIFRKQIKKIKRKNERKKMPQFIFFSTFLKYLGWLLNLRGNHIEYNQFCFGLCYYFNARVLLFTDISKFSTEIKNYFNEK